MSQLAALHHGTMAESLCIFLSHVLWRHPTVPSQRFACMSCKVLGYVVPMLKQLLGARWLSVASRPAGCCRRTGSSCLSTLISGSGLGCASIELALDVEVKAATYRITSNIRSTCAYTHVQYESEDATAALQKGFLVTITRSVDVKLFELHHILASYYRVGALFHTYTPGQEILPSIFA